MPCALGGGPPRQRLGGPGYNWGASRRRAGGEGQKPTIAVGLLQYVDDKLVGGAFSRQRQLELGLAAHGEETAVKAHVRRVRHLPTGP